MKHVAALYAAYALLAAVTAMAVSFGIYAVSRGWVFVAAWMFLFAAFDFTASVIGIVAERMDK